MSFFTRNMPKNKKTVEEIYVKYQNLMFLVANSIVRDSALAEDMVHDSIIKIIRYLDKITDAEINSNKVKNLVITIVKHTCYDELKRKKNIDFVSIKDTMYIVADENVDIENLIISNDTIASIAKSIDELNYKYSAVLQLRYFCELSFEEISDLLEITPETARKRLKCGRKLFIKHLPKGGFVIG